MVYWISFLHIFPTWKVKSFRVDMTETYQQNKQGHLSY